MQDLVIAQYQLSLIIKNSAISEELRQFAYSELLKIGLQISVLEAKDEHKNYTDSTGGKVQRQVHFN